MDGFKYVPSKVVQLREQGMSRSPVSLNAPEAVERMEKLHQALKDQVSLLSTPEFADKIMAAIEVDGARGAERCLHELALGLEGELLRACFEIDPELGQRIARRSQGKA